MNYANSPNLLQPGPLIQIVSMSVESEYKVIGVYGRVYFEYDDFYGETIVHDIYNREPDMAEVLLGTSRTLTLSGPNFSCRPCYAYMPLGEGSLIVELFDEVGNVFARQCVDLEDVKAGQEYDHINYLVVQGNKGRLVINCHVIPLGIFSQVVVFIHPKEDFKQENGKYCSLDLNGKIVARCGNRFGNYSSVESTLFKKQSHEFERTVNAFGSRKKDTRTLPLSRCWVSLPAYSSFCLDLELLEFGTGRKIVRGCAELVPSFGNVSTSAFVLDDMIVEVRVTWHQPKPRGPSIGYHENGGLFSARVMSEAKMDVEGEDESSSHDDSNDLLPSRGRPWILRGHVLYPSSGIQFFSIFIGSQSKPFKLYGSIKVLCNHHSVHIFKQERKNALFVSEHMKSIPLLDVPQIYDYESSDPLEIKVDLKDVEGNLAIKGCEFWPVTEPMVPWWHDKQLCSFIAGKNGFAAIHYSIFEWTFEANLKVFCKLKGGSYEVPPKIHGHFVAQYGCFNYSSDHFRIILLNKLQDDAVPLSADGRLPLSRSRVIVPLHSSLIIDLDLSIGVSVKKVACVKEILIGEGSTMVETNLFSICIEVDWQEVDYGQN